MDAYREYTIKILDMFEDLLDKHDITIPDDCREGLPSECRIYGITYGELYDRLREMLEELGELVQNSP